MMKLDDYDLVAELRGKLLYRQALRLATDEADSKIRIGRHDLAPDMREGLRPHIIAVVDESIKRIVAELNALGVSVPTESGHDDPLFG